MKPMSLFDITGRAMSAQLVRLNTTASNLANAGAVASTPEAAYRARKPVFQTMVDNASGSSARATVGVVDVVQASAEPTKIHAPDHPLADKDGYIYQAAVDSTQEMVELLESARQYQNNVEVMQTGKSLLLSTLKLGQ